MRNTFRHTNQAEAFLELADGLISILAQKGKSPLASRLS